MRPPLMLVGAAALALALSARACAASQQEWGPGSADPDAFSPIFPSPTSATNGSVALRVRPAGLRFTVASGSSGVLTAAVARYRKIMFAWGSGEGVQQAAGPELAAVTISVADGDDRAMQLGADESYTIIVPATAAATASLTANTTWGALRGLETLSQLVEWREEVQGYRLRMAPWAIADRPRFPYRGALIDSARHYLSVPALLRQIDALAYNKMNTLHWHAVDADSFPLELAAFPELAEKGAFSPKGRYSVSQQEQIVEYARQRGVRVLLETDLPGHSTAWSISHPELYITCPSRSKGNFGGFQRVIDPTLSATWEFLDKFFAELAKRFPDRYVHLGGDEVNVACFNASSSVRQWVAAQPNASLSDVYVHFETQVHTLAAKHNLSVQTWHNAFAAVQAAGKNLPKDAIAHVWMPTAKVNDPAVGMGSLVQAGASVVRSSGYYFNTGFFNGGLDVLWEDIINSDPMPPGLTVAEQSRVLGGEACMWGEVADEFFLDQKLWTRAAMVSERYWATNATITDYCQTGFGCGKNSWGTPTCGCTWHSPLIQAKLVKHRCRLLQRGIHAQPVDGSGFVPDRNRWSQCELFLPEKKPAQKTDEESYSGLLGARLRANPAVIDHPELACPPIEVEPNWPIYHVMNNFSGNASHRVLQGASDANAIFKYKGLFHAMEQPWAHAVSADGAHWYHVKQTLAPVPNSSWDGYECDGTVSFPDLGNGPTPVIMYGPDCGVPVPPPNSSSRLGSGSSDVPRVNMAHAADPDDPYLMNWVKTGRGPVGFNHTIPCSFPGRVWKSKIGDYWNMVCAKAAAWPAGGTGKSVGWERYTSHDPSLLTWTLASEPFVRQRDGKPAYLGSCSGAYFQKLPGGVEPYTHVIQSGCDGSSFFLGTYNHTTETLTLASDREDIVVDDLGVFSQKDAYHWGAAGREEPDSDPDSDSGRMFTIAWVASTAWQVPGFESLVREMSFDAAAGRLTSAPIRELSKLRNATHVDAASKSLAAGDRWTLGIPSGAGGALDVLVSFELPGQTAASPGGFGIAVRAPPTATADAALLITVTNITSPDATGTRNATVLFTPPPVNPGCKPTPWCTRPAGYKAEATVPVLKGESLDLRVLVDRPVIEAFFQRGRTSYVTADTPFSLDNSSVHLFNNGPENVRANVSAFGMGCGWSAALPRPAVRPHKTDDAKMFTPHVPNCTKGAPGWDTACQCQDKKTLEPVPCGPTTSDQCMPLKCIKITTGNMKGHCHMALCPECGSGVIRGPAATRYHLRDNACGNNDPNAGFYDPVHKLYHLFYQDHLGIPQYQNPRNKSDPSDTGSWVGGPAYGHLISRDFAHWAHLPVALWNEGSFNSSGDFKHDPSNSGGIFTGSTTMVNGGRDPIMVTPGSGYDIAVPLNRSDPYLTNWTRPCYHNPKNWSSDTAKCPNPIAHEGTSDDPSTAWRTPHGEWRLIGNNPHSGNNHPGFFAPIYSAPTFTADNANFTFLGNSSFPGGECPSFFPLPPLEPGSADPKDVKVNVPGWPPTHVHKVGHPACGGDCMIPGVYHGGAPGEIGQWEMFGTNSTDSHFYSDASTGPDHGQSYAGKDFWDPSTGRRLFNSWLMVDPNNTLGMFRSLTWHTELQQILTSPAAEYNLLREKKLVDKTNLQLPPTGSAVRLDSGLAPDAGRYAEIEVTFALPKSATNLSVVVMANPHGYKSTGYDGNEFTIRWEPPPSVAASPHHEYYEVTAGCEDCWRTGQGNGKPWKASDHTFPLRLLPGKEENLTVRVFMDGGFCEAYWMGGRAAQVMSMLNGTDAQWTGPDQFSAMYVRATGTEPATVLSAVAYSVGRIWVTPEQVLATPPPPPLQK